MIKILFVCLGNICRSPLAEGVFRNHINDKLLNNSVLCDSAGTAGYHIGALPDKRSIKIAADHGIELEHRGKKLSKEDFDHFDYIIAMDKTNYEDIIQLKNNRITKAKVLLFRDFDPIEKGNVPDPYYGTLNDFEEVYQICERTSDSLLNYTRNDLGK